MMRTRTMVVSGTVLLATAAIGYGAAIALDDPDRSVDAIAAGGTFTASGGSSPSSTLPASGGAASNAEPVEGLEQLAGTLRAGDDLDDWHLAGVDVDFGPDGWLQSAGPLGDFDGDGVDEALLDELRGLEGRDVTLGVRFELDDDRDDADVYTIDGSVYRDPAGGLAPWQASDRPLADQDAVAAAAAAAVGAGARVVDLEREDDGWEGWEAEVRGADGREYQVLLDPAGVVVDVRLDD